MLSPSALIMIVPLPTLPPCRAELESSNIVPTRSANSSAARLWRRYMQEDFSHHA